MTDKLSRIDNVACAHHLLETMKDIDFKHVKNMNNNMTNPKSFTTKIEWFSPLDKMPSGSDYILLTSGDDCFYLGALHPSGEYFYTDTYQDLIFEIKEIKYWAHLPTFSEVE